jgi:hypothetical protein
MFFFSFLIFFQIKIDDKHPKLNIAFIGGILKKVVFLPNSSKVATFLQKNLFFPCCFGELFCVKNQAYVLQILKYVTKYSSYLFIYLYLYCHPKKTLDACMD